VVADVHVTEVVPANWLWTLIDEPETEATEPVATGRLLATVVEDPEAPEGEAVELAVEPHAALTMPSAPTSRAASRPVRLRPPAQKHRNVMASPVCSTRCTCRGRPPRVVPYDYRTLLSIS
jgi:DTW domain-containing protein YfiP